MRYIFIILFIFISLGTSAQQTFELCEGETKTITYFAQSNGVGENVWEINGQTFLGEELTYTFTESGNYEIILRRENVICFDEEIFTVTISDCPGIIYWIPNSFTPDNNEHNQLFGPVMSEGFDINDFTFLIFNRWGEIIWESHDPNAKWDGTYNGTTSQDGIYTWKIMFNVLGNDGRVNDYGHVVILR